MIECPKETAYLFYHQGTPSDCQLCTPKIGLYYFASFEREPYEMPLHNHCLCSWEVIELSGIFSAKKEELANDLTRIESDLSSTDAEIAACEQRINELLQEIDQTQQARDDALENARLCIQKAEELQALAEELSTEEIAEELQDEIDALIQQAEEELEKADSYTEAAEELNLKLNELEAEKAGQETAKAAFEVRKGELLQDKKELEDCLELPIIEELAASIAGSKLVILA